MRNFIFIRIHIIFVAIIIQSSNIHAQFASDGPNNTPKIRLCTANAAFNCLIARHFDTECMTTMNIDYSVDIKTLNLQSQDSHHLPFAACIYHKLKPVTKDPQIYHEIYLPIEEMGNKEEIEGFYKIDNQLSSSTAPLDVFKHCRLQKIIKCFGIENCIMKSHYHTILNIFDQCKNATSEFAETNQKTFELPTIYSSSIMTEKQQLLRDIGNYPFTDIAKIRRFAQLEEDFKSYLCSK